MECRYLGPYPNIVCADVPQGRVERIAIGREKGEQAEVVTFVHEAQEVLGPVVFEHFLCRGAERQTGAFDSAIRITHG